MNFLELNINSIMSGKTADGVSYLELFLIEYKKTFQLSTVNAGCKKCVADYLEKYKLKFRAMSTNCDYILRKKREGLPVSGGSNEHITNANLTNKLAEMLVERYKNKVENPLEYLFEKYPKEVKEPKKAKTKLGKLDINTAEKKEVVKETTIEENQE